MFKKIEFKESGYPIIEICFWLIVALSIIYIFLIFFLDIYNFKVKSLNYPLEEIKVNLEYTKHFKVQNVFFCYNDKCASFEPDTYYNVYSSTFDNENPAFLKSKVKNIYLAYPKQTKDFENNIRNIDINIGNKNYYFTKEDIKKLDKKTVSLEIEDNNSKSEYTLIKFPKVSNYKGILSHIKILILSLFYNWQLFLFPYFWLTCAAIIYIFNNKKFKFKPKFEFNKKFYYSTFFLILFLGIFLRLVDITYFPLWNDEIYTKVIALDNFKACFQDAGNPPLFFIIDFVFKKLFSNSDFILRLPSFIFGVLFVYMTFVLFKLFSIKQALFASFLASINLINIYHSQEARGYALSMLLIVSSVYFLFRYLKEPVCKNLIFYGLLTALCVNNNYYLILFSFSNFIWGIVHLAQNKNKKEILKFISVNFICALTIIPYVLISMKTALSNDFNAWIPELSKETVLYIINAYFINKQIFISLCIVLLLSLILCYLPKKIKEKINIEINPDKENMFIYLIYSFVFILICASLISVFIKPIVHKRVLLAIYGLLFVLETLMIIGIFDFKKINNYLKSFKLLYSIILMFVCFSITVPMPLRELINTYNFMKFVLNDSKLYSNEYEIHVLTADTFEQLKAYPKIMNNKKIHWHFFNANNGSTLYSIKKTDYIEGDKKAVLYFNSIGIEIHGATMFNPKAYLYETNLIPNGKIVYK